VSGFWRNVALGSVIGFALSAGHAPAEDAIGGDMVVTKGMKPWEGCGECHDLNGVAPNGHFPNLAGQNANYIRKQMEDFSNGRRTNDHGQMETSAEEAMGATLDKVISYFAGLPPPSPVSAQDLSPAAAARAESLFEQGSRAERIPACSNCHGVNRKHALDAPWLEAQQSAYLAKELHDFQSGARTNDPNGWMQKTAHVLSDEDIASLAVYLASLLRPGQLADGTAESGGPSR
jgi:cytochrome c553